MEEEREITREEVVAWLKGFASALYRHAPDRGESEEGRDLERHANSIYRAINTIEVIKIDPVEPEEAGAATEGRDEPTAPEAAGEGSEAAAGAEEETPADV